MGHLNAGWVTGDDHFGQAPDFRDQVAAAGWLYVLDVPAHLTVWPVALNWDQAPYPGVGRPAHPRPTTTRQTVAEHRRLLRPSAWRILTVGEGAQGPRIYQFAFERVYESRQRQPGQELWLVHKANLDGIEPRSFFSNAPPDTPVASAARSTGLHNAQASHPRQGLLHCHSLREQFAPGWALLELPRRLQQPFLGMHLNVLRHARETVDHADYPALHC